MKIKSLEVKRWFEVTAIMVQGQLEKTMYRKTCQLPIFIFYKRELLEIINGVIGNVKSGWGSFTQTLNYHVLCKEGKLQKEV